MAYGVIGNRLQRAQAHTAVVLPLAIQQLSSYIIDKFIKTFISLL